MKQTKRFKLIACEVLTREVFWCAARSPHTIDVEFTPKGAHESGDLLRDTIREILRKTEESDTAYDAVLLGYGLCGNGTSGLSSSRFPLVIPRAHDCCTLFLGSRLRFRELFEDNPSRPFSSTGYTERGDTYLHASTTGTALGLDKTFEEYAAEYGEENARYIMESIQGGEKSASEELYYIDIPETSLPEMRELCLKQAGEEGYRVTEWTGNIRLIRSLLFGEWKEDEFLIVPPGEQIRPLYDWDLIIESAGE